MLDSWTFTKDYASWKAGAAIYPNACLSEGQFRFLRDKGTLVLTAKYAAPSEVAEAPKRKRGRPPKVKFEDIPQPAPMPAETETLEKENHTDDSRAEY